MWKDDMEEERTGEGVARAESKLPPSQAVLFTFHSNFFTFRDLL
jgi:hypothetical protein